MNDFYHGGNLREAQDKYGIYGKKIIDFSASINPLGLPTGVKRLIIKNINSILNYPDSYNRLLVSVLSEKHKISKENILIGNGSNELIYLLINSLLPKKVLIPSPSFSEYKKASLAAGSDCLFSDLLDGGKNEFSLKNILNYLDKSIGLIFISNPHNPIGNLWSKEELKYLIERCQRTNTIILIDEAFMPFVTDEKKYSVVDLIKSNDNLFVLRSMTKIYAIPGLRLGYLLGHRGIISRMISKQPNWQINSIAQSIGPLLLRDDKYLAKSKFIVSKLKDIFYFQLKEFKWIEPFYPSVNYIFCRLKNSLISSKELRDYLIRNHNILIRDCSNFRGLDQNFIRVAVKNSRENLKLIKCLKNFTKEL